MRAAGHSRRRLAALVWATAVATAGDAAVAQARPDISGQMENVASGFVPVAPPENMESGLLPASMVAVLADSKLAVAAPSFDLAQLDPSPQRVSGDLVERPAD